VLLLRLRAMALLLLEHASSYAELGAAAVEEYRRALLRRALLLSIGVLLGVAGLAALWLGGLVALWETPWRLAYVMGSAMVLLVIAGATLYGALARSEPGPSTGMLRAELRKDMELFQQWKGTL
jgi:uncharacterized membrane protein YqjE